MESVRLKDLEIGELKKKIEEERARLSTQQALYESVRAERNLFGKQQIESQDEIAEVGCNCSHSFRIHCMRFGRITHCEREFGITILSLI